MGTKEQSYDNDGNLLPGLYLQAIFFSDNGTFNKKEKYNIGSSTATVYLADGKTQTFDAMTYPSDPDIFATVPEGIYQANVGTHKGYKALKVRDIGAKLQTISLGKENPAYSDQRTYATGIDIHKAGNNNYTGVTKGGSGVSKGCLLIDVYKWSDFIGNFDAESKISVTVSRSLQTPTNTNSPPVFNFILNGTINDYINTFRNLKTQ